MFVRFECGCVGIHVLGGQTLHARQIVVKPCDADRDEPDDALRWALREGVSRKPWTPLPADEETELHVQLARRLGLADRFDNVRMYLGIKEE